MIARIHRTAEIALNAKWGEDVIIDEYVVIKKDVKIGNRVVIKCRATLSVGVVVEDNCFIGPHALLLHETSRGIHNPCRIMAGAYIGGGAIILPGVKVGGNCVIGAGAVVTHDTDWGTYIGVPARRGK